MVNLEKVMRALRCATKLVINHPYYIILHGITLYLLHYIKGPVHNIMVNVKEVMRALVFATELAFNHTYTPPPHSHYIF